MPAQPADEGSPVSFSALAHSTATAAPCAISRNFSRTATGTFASSSAIVLSISLIAFFLSNEGLSLLENAAYIGLLSCDYLITPCKADRFSASAINNVESIVEEVLDSNSTLRFLGAFINDFDTRYTVSKKLKEVYGQNTAIFFKSYVRRSSCFDIACLEGKPVLCYSGTTGAEDFMKVTEEMVRKIQGTR